ncbi:MAG: sensor histidine kinase [Bacteroidota bacterium]
MNTTKTARQRSKPKTQEIDFKQIVACSVKSLMLQEGAHRLNIKTTIEGLIPFVADKEMVEVIFTNIISNSIKFRHPHEANPTLDIHVDLGPKNVVITFKDNGIGIDREYVGKVFDMFFCAPCHNNDGSGLGLFAVREAVKRMKGTIAIQSVKGTGTTLVAELPNRIDPDLKRKLIKLIDNSK